MSHAHYADSSIHYSSFGSDAVLRPSVAHQTERERLDNLIGLALLDENVRERLLVRRDSTLLDDFGLSKETQHWLASIQAASLKEFAQAIVVGFKPFTGRTPSRAI